MVNSLDIKCDSDKQWSTVVYRNIYIYVYMITVRYIAS